MRERRRKDSQEGAHRRTNYCGLAAGGSRWENDRDLPQAGIRQATFYNWRKQYAGLGVQELRELRWYEESLQQLLQLVSWSRKKRVQVLLAEAQERIRDLEQELDGEDRKRAA